MKKFFTLLSMLLTFVVGSFAEGKDDLLGC